ncbi:substrate-binding periplasmic protein [Paraglaciecola hydrolytica]|uniref:Solute-binding protein family 3/N-terminal domain-containing protein n=1 Tax=Paraglaciecola hydrolytica TaxID=1799789 RepID=A0A148KLL4_9ALTE|nr:transporter substrate-binding domain-containing protein [Paraglaciecola hydrolytica]KXI27170.1 hypothetical protein AX660_01940 [Paraglaciecola hydrolytica]
MLVELLSLYQFLAGISLLVFTLCLSNSTLAKEQIQVVTENWYPYNYLDEKQQVVGQSTTLVKQVLRAAEVDFTFDLYPWTRAMNLAKTTQNVLIYTILQTPERQSMFHWICPIAAKNLHQLYRLSSRSDIDITSEQDIKNYSVAVTRDTFLHKLMLKLGLKEGQNLQVTGDDKINATLLLAGRVDILPELQSSVYRQLVTQGLDKSYVTPLLSLSANHYPDYCMALSKPTPLELVEKIRAAHQKITDQ